MMERARTITVAGGCLLDPRHGMTFNRRDLSITDGIIDQEGAGQSSTDTLDVDGRIVVPGGIYPSFRLPGPGPCFDQLDPTRIAGSLLLTGFTTIIVEGMTPFTALATHSFLRRVPVIHKVPFLDVGNMQAVLGYVKTGVSNYVAELVSTLFREYKAAGMSCLVPGSALHWHGETRRGEQGVLQRAMPLLGTSIEGIVQELAGLATRDQHASNLLVETGIEGIPGAAREINDMIGRMHEHAGGNKGVPVTFKHASRVLANDAAGPDAIELLCTQGSSTCMDVPCLFGDAIQVEVNPFDVPGTARGKDATIEGEVFKRTVPASMQDHDAMAREWRAGIEAIVHARKEGLDGIAFSVAPGLPDVAPAIAKTIASVLSPAARRQVLGQARDEGWSKEGPPATDDAALTLGEFIKISRSVPATIAGIHQVVGSLAPGQSGDVVVLDAREDQLESILGDPARATSLFSKPWAVLVRGNVACKQGELALDTRGVTFLRSIPVNASITGAVRQSLDKQFLKHYSTHVDATLVADAIVAPVRTMERADR